MVFARDPAVTAENGSRPTPLRGDAQLGSANPGSDSRAQRLVLIADAAAVAISGAAAAISQVAGLMDLPLLVLALAALVVAAVAAAVTQAIASWDHPAVSRRW